MGGWLATHGSIKIVTSTMPPHAPTMASVILFLCRYTSLNCVRSGCLICYGCSCWHCDPSTIRLMALSSVLQRDANATFVMVVVLVVAHLFLHRFVSKEKGEGEGEAAIVCTAGSLRGSGTLRRAIGGPRPPGRCGSDLRTRKPGPWPHSASRCSRQSPHSSTCAGLSLLPLLPTTQT